MALSLYVRRDTCLHALHPLTKMVLLALIFAGALAVTHPLPTALLALFVLSGAVAARALRPLLRMWPLLASLFVVTALIWTWAHGAPGPAIRIGPIVLPERGALFGLAMGLRLDLFLAAGLVFLATTRIESFAAALERLGLPPTAGFVLTLAFRLVPVYVDTALTVVQAQRARGYDLDRGSPWTRVRRRARLIVPVFLAGLRNADGMALALEARGFGRRGAARGTVLEERFGWRDAAALAAGVIVLAAIAWLRRRGWGGV